jgi:hypothetical protein
MAQHITLFDRMLVGFLRVMVIVLVGILVAIPVFILLDILGIIN